MLFEFFDIYQQRVNHQKRRLTSEEAVGTAAANYSTTAWSLAPLVGISEYMEMIKLQSWTHYSSQFTWRERQP